MRDETFGFCPDCGRALKEPTEDGRCPERDECTSRVAAIEFATHRPAVRREAERLWSRTARLA